MLRLTDAFIWEDLPSTDPVTGSLTMAAWIPRIQKFTTIITTTAFILHVIQITILFFTSDDRYFVFGTWYPFDATKSPTYELINITQVKRRIIGWVYNVLIYIVSLECTLRILTNSTYTLLMLFGTLQWLNFAIRTFFGVGMFTCLDVARYKDFFRKELF
jgi:hypothetical protein